MEERQRRRTELLIELDTAEASFARGESRRVGPESITEFIAGVGRANLAADGLDGLQAERFTADLGQRLPLAAATPAPVRPAAPSSGATAPA